MIRCKCFLDHLRIMVGHSDRLRRFKCSQRKSFINTNYSQTLTLYVFYTNQKQYIKRTFGCTIMTLIYCSGVHALFGQTTNRKNQRNKLYRASWEFEFSYKLYLDVQLSWGTPHLISPDSCKNTGRKCVNIGDIGYDCSEKKIHKE